MTQTFISLTEFADLINVRPDTLVKYKLPEPDARIGNKRGWTMKTIEDWQAARPGKGRWGHGPRPKTATSDQTTGKFLPPAPVDPPQ